MPHDSLDLNWLSWMEEASWLTIKIRILEAPRLRLYNNSERDPDVMSNHGLHVTELFMNNHQENLVESRSFICTQCITLEIKIPFKFMASDICKKRRLSQYVRSTQKSVNIAEESTYR